jgi:hypothetical protein
MAYAALNPFKTSDLWTPKPAKPYRIKEKTFVLFGRNTDTHNLTENQKKESRSSQILIE